MRVWRVVLAMSVAIGAAGCGDGAIVVPDRPHERLSEFGFFTGRLADLTPAERVLPYDLNSALFTDYAGKERFVWMPEGAAARYTAEGPLEFPEGTVLIKNFYYGESPRREIIETRLLIHRGEEWEAVGYIWNDEQTEAVRDVVGGVRPVTRLTGAGARESIDYIIPNRNQCKSCHLDGKRQVPIGPKVRNLNRDYPYPDGAANQLEKWAEVGYLTGYDPIASHPRVAVWDDAASGTLHERAMAYLDINCGHCHNPTGSANTSGLHLVAEAPSDISLGIYKAPVSAGSGTGGRSYSIVPGQPEASILMYRMESTDPAVRMPELGRSLVHAEGADLIREWIRSMAPHDPRP